VSEDPTVSSKVASVRETVLSDTSGPFEWARAGRSDAPVDGGSYRSRTPRTVPAFPGC